MGTSSSYTTDVNTTTTSSTTNRNNKRSGMDSDNYDDVYDDDDDQTSTSHNDAVAISAALVGESVADSVMESTKPTTTRTTVIHENGRQGEQEMSISTTDQHQERIDNNNNNNSSHSSPNQQQQQQNLSISQIKPFVSRASSSSSLPNMTTTTNMNANGDNGLSVGLMAQGLAWVQEQRVRRRRQYLQNLAEQQLRKLETAVHHHHQQPEQQEDAATTTTTSTAMTSATTNKQPKGRSLLDNPTFQTIIGCTANNTTLVTTTTTTSLATSTTTNDCENHYNNYDDNNTTQDSNRTICYRRSLLDDELDSPAAAAPTTTTGAHAEKEQQQKQPEAPQKQEYNAIMTPTAASATTCGNLDPAFPCRDYDDDYDDCTYHRHDHPINHADRPLPPQTNTTLTSSFVAPNNYFFPSNTANHAGDPTTTTASMDAPAEKESRIPTMHRSIRSSKSGDGFTAELLVSMSSDNNNNNDGDDENDNDDDDAHWVAPVRIEEEDGLESNPYILSRDQMQQIAEQVLPAGISYCKWRRLYSLTRDGDSFDTCLRLIQSVKPTLVIVRTTKNVVLGGFAEEAWEPHTAGGLAQYYGGPTSCLFTFYDPQRNKKQNARKIIKSYKWTGANRYIQLTDTSHRMLAFGGGNGVFGLSMERDFQVGSTGPCATFRNEPLAGDENFNILDVEIYGFLLGQF